jgi:AraC-like DNA-binding protein
MDIKTKLIRIDNGNASHGSFIDAEYVLHIILKGTFTFQSQQKSYSIEPKDMILIPPYKLHALNEINDVTMLVIHFYDHSSIIETYKLPTVVSINDLAFKQIKQLCFQLTQLLKESKEENEQICNGLIHTLIGCFIKYSNHHKKESNSNRQFYSWKSIQKAVAYIQENFTNPNITIAEISDYCKFSHNYFSYLFKEYTNESPHHYLTRVRLEYAKENLYNGKCNISEAAISSGFCNLQYFSKVFKKEEGISPSEWLKKIQLS